jgi:hypothetical protein
MKFHVHASQQRRLFSRIFQILESQRVIIHSFSGETSDCGARRPKKRLKSAASVVTVFVLPHKIESLILCHQQPLQLRRCFILDGGQYMRIALKGEGNARMPQLI